MAPPFVLSKDKIELQFAKNQLGHFLLTQLLLETMKHSSCEQNKEGRIVNVSSDVHRFAYKGIYFDHLNNKSRFNIFKSQSRYAFNRLPKLPLKAYSTSPSEFPAPGFFDLSLSKEFFALRLLIRSLKSYNISQNQYDPISQTLPTLLPQRRRPD